MSRPEWQRKLTKELRVHSRVPGLDQSLQRKKPLSLLLFLQHQQPRFAGFVSVVLFIQDILENKITRHSGLCLWTASGVGAKAGRYLECVYSKLILALINSLSPGSTSLFLLLSYVIPKLTVFEMYKDMLPNGHYCHLLNHQGHQSFHLLAY